MVRMYRVDFCEIGIDFCEIGIDGCEKVGRVVFIVGFKFFFYGVNE